MVGAPWCEAMQRREGGRASYRQVHEFLAYQLSSASRCEPGSRLHSQRYETRASAPLGARMRVSRRGGVTQGGNWRENRHRCDRTPARFLSKVAHSGSGSTWTSSRACCGGGGPEGQRDELPVRVTPRTASNQPEQCWQGRHAPVFAARRMAGGFFRRGGDHIVPLSLGGPT
jgi:hypothetical protein